LESFEIEDCETEVSCYHSVTNWQSCVRAAVFIFWQTDFVLQGTGAQLDCDGCPHKSFVI